MSKKANPTLVGGFVVGAAALTTAIADAMGGTCLCRTPLTPDIILADEPTANLDSHTSEDLMALFTELNEHHNTTFVIATHDQRVMAYAKRLVRMLDGRIVEDIDQNAA